jgi:hypothetical protein
MPLPNLQYGRVCKMTGLALILLGLATPVSMILIAMMGGYVLLYVSPAFVVIGLLMYVAGRFLYQSPPPDSRP